MVPAQSFMSEDEASTIAFAQKLAADSNNKDIFTLQGPLGAGKSVFARAFIQHLIDEKTDIPSPTFTLVQTYDSYKGPLWHFDLYRTQTPEEIYEIGWEEALSGGILLIEWPERLGPLLPLARKEIIFEPLTGESRKISYIHHQGSRP